MTHSCAATTPRPTRVVLMGVSGCGKSTVGEGLAAHLGWRFVEGDSLHPPENVAKMAAGQALGDGDRAGWLATLADVLAQASAAGQGLVISCSALKRAYRDLLRAASPGLRFVFLDIDREEAARRVAARASSHFFSSSLVDSQFATLEPPGPDEAIRMDVDQSLTRLISQILAVLKGPVP